VTPAATDDSPRGIELARGYWHELVEPLLDRQWPGLPVAAARVGTGSDVLGLDDAMSRDHDWGLRLQLFVDPAHIGPVTETLTTRLPERFRGLPTRFAFTGADHPRLGIDVTTVAGFLHARLGFDPREGAAYQDWLSITGQAALEVTGGAVFADPTGELTSARQVMDWYPPDVWRYVLACDWQRIDEELPLMGRAADRGDELGSRVIAARLVDVTSHLAFTVARRWTPYPKWRGTLLAGLAIGPSISPHLERALASTDWTERSAALAVALRLVVDQQRAAGLPSVAEPCRPFWDRPYLRIDPELTMRLIADITDPQLRSLPTGLGSAEQRTNSVAILTDPALRLALVRSRAA